MMKLLVIVFKTQYTASYTQTNRRKNRQIRKKLPESNNCLHYLQKQLFADVVQSRCSKKFLKIYRKAIVPESLFYRSYPRTTASAFHKRKCFSVLMSIK